MPYYINICKANISCDTGGTEIAKITIPKDSKGAKIVKIATSSDAVNVDITRNGQTLGAKYGLPWDARAIALFSNGMDVNVELNPNDDIKIVGYGIGGTVTLNAITVIIEVL